MKRTFIAFEGTTIVGVTSSTRFTYTCAVTGNIEGQRAVVRWHESERQAQQTVNNKQYKKWWGPLRIVEVREKK